MKDLFGAPKTNGHSYPFYWVCAVFNGDGAVEVIKRAYQSDIKTYFPIRKNHRNEYVPLWRSYLFVEWRETVTIDLCRTTTRFIKIVSERDEDGILHPILVRKDGINESLRMVTKGKFDDVTFQRRTYGRGSIVRVLEGNFIDQKVRLETDITPDMVGRTKVKVDINGLRATIELFKLAL